MASLSQLLSLTDINYVMEVGMEVCDKGDSHNFDRNIF